MIQFETSDILVGNTNIAGAIETSDDLLYSETYVIVGKKHNAKRIHANYDLIVVCDLEAEEIEVNGELIVRGNIKADYVRCQKLVCTGKTQVGVLQSDEDVIAKYVVAEKVQTQGTVMISDTLIVDEECLAERNILAGEGISGTGIIKAESAVVGDYFDFDGDIKTNVYEIATMFEKKFSASDKTDEVIDNQFDIRLKEFLNEFWESVIEKEEDDILSEIYKYGDMQALSFAEFHYLFSEIIRISYLPELSNLRDYMLVKCAEKYFPEKLLEYETIEHVFRIMIDQVELEELDYRADNLMQFSFSLKIVLDCFNEDSELYLDRIFSSIGLKYDFVKKQFERN